MNDSGAGPARPIDATRKGTALITGASSGLGEEFAWQLAAAGHDLVIVARRRERLEALKHEIEQAAGVTVEVIAADLARAEGRERVADRLTDMIAPPIGLLVNNAGFGLGQRFVGGDLDRENEAIEVMIRAVMELSYAATSVMVPRGRGAILNVSSMVAQTAMGTYAAAKAWVKTFTEALAGELAGTGVTATAVSPGLVRTEFHTASGMKESAWPELGWLDAEDVVADALAAVRRGAVHVTPSLRYKSLQGLMKIAPRALVRKIGGPQMWERAMSGGPRRGGTLAELYDAEGARLTGDERDLLSRVRVKDPAVGQWLVDGIGDGFGLTPANLLTDRFDRYVQIRFAVERAWVSERLNHTYFGPTPPWEEPVIEGDDWVPSRDPADWEATYERVRLNPSQWAALGEHLTETAGPVTVGWWEGYGGFTATDGEPGFFGEFLEKLGIDAVPRSSAMLVWDGGEDVSMEQAEAETAEHARRSRLHELPAAVREGAKLELPGRAHIVVEFDSWRDLEAYLTWNEPFAELPNLMWPADRSWACAIEIDGGSVLVGCDADLAEQLIADERLYAEPIGAHERALGDTDPADPAIDPLVEYTDLD